MDARFAIFVFVSATALMVMGATLDELKGSEEWPNRKEDMKFCLNQENVTEEQMTDFVLNNNEQEDNESLKMAVYCFLKRINFFDGVSWNMEVIAESEAKNPKMLKVIRECLAKDDFMQPAQERSYQAQKCVLENGVVN